MQTNAHAAQGRAAGTTPLLFGLSIGAVAALILLAASPALGQGRFEGARPMGMASAFTASASGNGALYHNPAGVGTIFMYSVEGSYQLSPDGFNTLNASIVDSKLNPKLAAGAAYSYEFNSDEDNNFTGHDARVALASPVVPERLVLGVGGRYLSFTQGKEDLLSGFTLDVGATLRIADGFFMGVSGNNLIDPCQGNDDDCPAVAAPRSVGGGLAFGSSIGFLISADVRADFSPDDDVRMIYAGGAEILLAQVLALRAGYQYRDLEKENVLGVGGGIKTDAVGIDVGYQRRFEAKEDILNIAIQLYFFL